MTAAPQGRAVLDCQAHGQPPVTIKWLKNGARLAESEHIQFLPNGSLYIPKTKHTKEESDEGFYQCLSQNKYGAILSQRSRLTIASEYIEVKVSFLQVRRGHESCFHTRNRDVYAEVCKLMMRTHSCMCVYKHGKFMAY